MPARLRGAGFGSVRAGAFTLIEMLAVVVILGILAALLIPAFSGMSVRAQQVESTSRLRQIGAAFLLYAADKDGKLPPSNSTGRWPYHIQPYMGMDPAKEPFTTLKDFCCPTQDYLRRAIPRTALGLYGYNQFFLQDAAARNWSRLSQIDSPSTLPLIASASGEGEFPGSLGSGGQHMGVGGPHPSAKRYGYSGQTAMNGPAPNLKGTTIYLMADMHVMATKELWPWSDFNGTDFHPKRITSINAP